MAKEEFELSPRVSPDSHLPAERAIYGNRTRFTQIGLLEFIARGERPSMLTPDGDRVFIPVAALIAFLLEATDDQLFREINQSQDESVQSRINAYRGFLAGIRSQRNNETQFTWQEHLLRLLESLGYTPGEIKSGVIMCFPSDSKWATSDFKLAFNRAANYVWGVGADKLIYK